MPYIRTNVVSSFGVDVIPRRTADHSTPGELKANVERAVQALLDAGVPLTANFQLSANWEREE